MRVKQESVGQLLSMAETGVDLAWRELAGKTLSPLLRLHSYFIRDYVQTDYFSKLKLIQLHEPFIKHLSR